MPSDPELPRDDAPSHDDPPPRDDAPVAPSPVDRNAARPAGALSEFELQDAARVRAAALASLTTVVTVMPTGTPTVSGAAAARSSSGTVGVPISSVSSNANTNAESSAGSDPTGNTDNNPSPGLGRPVLRYPGRVWAIAIGLYIATWISTFCAQSFGAMLPIAMLLAPVETVRELAALPREMLYERVFDGLLFAGSLMAILTAHEAGHYFAALWHRVPATPPFFIPFPFSIMGTMGAVIFQVPGIPNRRVLFDIGASGPWAGLVVAVPVLIYGIPGARVLPVTPEMLAQSLYMEDPLLIRGLVWWFFGPVPAGHEIFIGPLVTGAWMGLLVTGINLLPIGQLDGGHVLHAVFGKQSKQLARAVYVGCILAVIAAGIFITPIFFGWSLMLFLVGLMRPSHPPTLDDSKPLGTTRTVLAGLTLLALVVTFIPIPPVPYDMIQPTTPETKPGEKPGEKPEAVPVEVDAVVRHRHRNDQPEWRHRTAVNI